MSRRLIPTYGLVACGALLLAAVSLHLWRADWTIPFYYANGGDALFTSQLTHAMWSGGWILNEPQLAAPFGANFGDFPVPNLLHLALLKILILIVQNDSLALNLYFVAFFPLTSMIAFGVLRRFGVSTIASVAIALIYSIMPYRFMRNEAHLFYAGYYCAPLIVLISLLLLTNAPLIDRADRRPTRDGMLSIGAALLIALDNQYFVLFAAVLFCLGAILGAVRHRSIAPLLTTLVLLATMIAGFAVNVSPYLLYNRTHTFDSAAVTRTPEAAEVYALTLAQLVLPIQSHRIAKLSDKRAFYDRAFPPLVNENSSVSLGIIGTLGFLASLAIVIFLGAARDELAADLGLLNMAAFLLATVGGFGALITYFGTELFRAYNRIAPVIAFSSLGVVAVLADRARRAFGTTFRRRLWIGAAIVGLVAVAIFDQTSPIYVPPYALDLAAFSSDAAVAQRVSSDIPGGMVFQLPYVRFPESPPVERLGSWDELAIEQHTHDVGWSFGATTGRYEADWMSARSSEPTQQMLADLLLAGFNGVAIYHKGFADDGASLIDGLSALTGVLPFTSPAGDVTIFTFPKLANEVRAAFGEAFTAAQEREKYDAIPSFSSGFYPMETAGGRSWRWADADSVIAFDNHGPAARHIVLHFLAAAARASTLTMRGTGPAYVVRVSPSGTVVDHGFDIPPGPSVIHIQSSVPGRRIGSDLRSLAFQMFDFSSTDVSTTLDRNRVLAVLRRVEVLPQSAFDVEWTSGFSTLEQAGGATWHWSSEHGRVTIVDHSHRAAVVHVHALAISPHPGMLDISIDGRHRVVATNDRGMPIDFDVSLRGRHDIDLTDTAVPLVVPGDVRRLVFQLRDFELSAKPASAER